MSDIKTVSFDRNCATCRQLWQEYAHATNAHINLSGKQEIASLQHDYESAVAIERNVTAADETRHAARTALKKHEDEHRAAENNAPDKP